MYFYVCLCAIQNTGKRVTLALFTRVMSVSNCTHITIYSKEHLRFKFTFVLHTDKSRPASICHVLPSLLTSQVCMTLTQYTTSIYTWPAYFGHVKTNTASFGGNRHLLKATSPNNTKQLSNDLHTKMPAASQKCRNNVVSLITIVVA